jgi:hypothetical protein
MYLSEYPELNGLGKSRFKKLVKKVGKVVKKLAPVIVPVVGGALATKLYSAYAARRKAAGASDAQIEAEAGALRERGISPEQAAQQFQPSSLFTPSPGAPDVSAPVRQESEAPETMPKPALPVWLLPAAVAAGVAFIAMR